MRWALEEGKEIDALVIPRNRRLRALRCPTCGARVHFRPGRVREAHFAHNPGEESADCENYTPGGVPSVPAPRTPAAEWDSAESELGLALIVDEASWSLLVRLPELTAAGMNGAPLSSFERASVVVRTTGDQRQQTISATELRAGVAAARMAIVPSSSSMQLMPAGTWPKGVRTELWRTTVQGLRVSGVLFRRRGGEWHRIRDASAVVCGEELVLTSRGHAPPSALSPKPLGCHPNAADWWAWTVRLPDVASTVVSKWITSLGYALAPTPWSVQVVSAPLFADEDLRLFDRRSFVFRICAPKGESRADLSITSGTNTHISVEEPGFFSAATSHGDLELRVNGELRTGLSVELCDPPPVGRVNELLRLLPRLVVGWGESQLGPGAYRLRRADEPISVDCGGARVRLTLVIETTEGRQVHLSVAPARCAELIDAAISTATGFSIDAGPLGYVAVEFVDCSSSAVDGMGTSWVSVLWSAPPHRTHLRSQTLAWAATVARNPVARALLRTRHKTFGRR
jgi:hypothetical protein